MNFTRYRNVVEKLSGFDRIALAGFQNIASSVIEGQPYGVLYGTRYLRNDAGQLMIGEDGFPLVDDEMGVIGDPNPDWLMGIENEFSWKGSYTFFLVGCQEREGILWNGTVNTLHYLGVSDLTGRQRSTTDFVFDGVNLQGQG